MYDAVEPEGAMMTERDTRGEHEHRERTIAEVLRDARRALLPKPKPDDGKARLYVGKERTFGSRVKRDQKARARG